MRISRGKLEDFDGHHDRSEDVVQVMGNAAGQRADALHALGPKELLLELFGFGKVDDKAHAIVRATTDETTLGVCGVFGDDVDDSVNRIRAPNRGTRAANHLNPVDIIHDQALKSPVNTAKKWVIDRAPIDENQEFRGKNPSKTTDGDADI